MSTINSRLDKDVARLTQQLESLKDAAAKATQQQQLDAYLLFYIYLALFFNNIIFVFLYRQANKATLASLHAEVRAVAQAVAADRESARSNDLSLSKKHIINQQHSSLPDELQQHEQRVQAQCAQQQRQIAALSADVRTMHAAGFVLLFDFYFNSNYSRDGI
jgi:cell division septum initiation protein DivIVA